MIWPVPHGVAVGYGIIDRSRFVQFTCDNTCQEHRPNDGAVDDYHATLSHLIDRMGAHQDRWEFVGWVGSVR